MPRTFFAAALVAFTSANSLQNQPMIVYPGDQVDLIRIDSSEYPMVFKWPEEGFRCGGTMVSDRMALTAAHCVNASENSSDPNLTIRLSDGEVYGIQEIRTNECWNFSAGGGPYSADIAIIVLDRPIPNAVEGVHYVKTWDAASMGDVAGREFILAGWGASGEVNDEGDYDESHHNSQIFHRGYNVINEIRDNMLIYTMDRPENGGLDLESMGHYGDSGSGALMLVDDEIHIIGVKSNGGPAQWGTSHQYTRVGGYHRDWVEANLVSDTRIAADGCSASGGDGGSGVYDECADTNIRSDNTIIGDRDGDGCDLYAVNPSWCGGSYDTTEFISADMCCACGGGRDLGEESGDDGGNDSGDDGVEDSGDDGVEDSGDEQEINCQCECDAYDLTCWLGCYECLEDIFGSESEGGDEGQESEEEPPTPVGIECQDQCQPCTFDMMECWEECHACLDPHFSEDAIQV